MRTQLLLILLATLLTAAWSCKSHRHDPPPYDPDDVICICGTPEAQFEGCPHPLCLRGVGNPDNEDCVCGSLFDDEDEPSGKGGNQP